MVKGLQTKHDFEQMFPQELLDNIGDRWLHRWRGSQKLRYCFYLALIEDAVDFSSIQDALDIGCAQGNFLNILRSKYPHVNLYGTDISENAIEWNKKHYPDICFKYCALPDIGFPPSSFDFISALEVIYYLDESQRLLSLQNMVAALRSGGYLLISGVLDGGVNYFSEEWIIKEIARFLSVKQIIFNYARCYTKFERPLLRSLDIVLSLQQLITQDALKSHNRLAHMKFWKKWLVKFLSLPWIRSVSKLFLTVYTSLLRTVLGWVWLPRVCLTITRLILGNAGKSHVIILARKE